MSCGDARVVATAEVPCDTPSCGDKAGVAACGDARVVATTEVSCDTPSWGQGWCRGDARVVATAKVPCDGASPRRIERRRDTRVVPTLGTVARPTSPSCDVKTKRRASLHTEQKKIARGMHALRAHVPS